MNLSKSRYCMGVRCPKDLWLSIYKPEEAKEQDSDVNEENGNKVGDLARHIFGDKYVLIEYNDDYQIMIDETKKHLEEKDNIICEASFDYDGNFCAVDILKNDKDGVEIYEVKSSTDINETYINDISYQTWVLKKCGLNVKKSYIVYVNSDYVKHGELDIKKYFHIKDVTELLDDKVEEKVKKLKEVINSKQEPAIDLSLNCKKSKKKVSYDCPFFSYCTKDLVKPNVFDVGWSVHFSKKLKYYYQNIISYSDLLAAGGLSPKADIQMNYELYDLKAKINIESIKELLNTFSYPLYFLDFESFQVPIPKIDGTKPYQQICFQYSLHYYLEEDGELYHKEFLSTDYDGNPMYGLCKQLCEDIPLNSCVLVYNDSFEIPRLREMAPLFPEFSDHLLNIVSNIKDLLPPFKNQDYYVRGMGGSFSIKQVLPALFPNDSNLDYHNLDQVHKGDEASSSFLLLPTLPPEEQKKLRVNMLKYCGLDTYAMVMIFQYLRKVCGNYSIVKKR